MLEGRDHSYGKQDQIPLNTIVTRSTYNKRIKPIGVMKVGISALRLGNACGMRQDSGLTVAVSVVFFALMSLIGLFLR
jgi:hypothetical protein